MPSLKLTPTFCMEDMYTLDMPDTMDIPMVDMATLDKLFPLISKWTANHPCFLYQLPHFQCLTSFLGDR